jgi:hypothetical protein
LAIYFSVSFCLYHVSSLSGAEFLAKDLGLLVENATEEQLGTARKVTIHQTTTTLIVDAASKDERLGADIIQKVTWLPYL